MQVQATFLVSLGLLLAVAYGNVNDDQKNSSDVKYSMSTTHSPMSGMKIVKDNATIGQDGNHTLKSDTFTKASGDEASSAKLNNQFPQEAFSPKGPTVYIPRIPKISVNQREDSENQK